MGCDMPHIYFSVCVCVCIQGSVGWTLTASCQIWDTYREREENKASYFIGVRGKDGKHNFFGQGLSADKKAICIPQSFGDFGLFGGCIFVNTGPSELLNLSVHKHRAPWKRETQQRRFYTCCMVKLLKFSLRFWCTAVEEHAVMTALQTNTNTTRYVLKYKAAGELCDWNGLSWSVWDQ